jgi:hypothetical protein
MRIHGIYPFIYSLWLFLLVRFDRGVVRNVLEFLLIPGFSIDYIKIMTLSEDTCKAVGGRGSEVGDATEMTTTSPMASQQQHVHGPDCKHHH